MGQFVNLCLQESGYIVHYRSPQIGFEAVKSVGQMVSMEHNPIPYMT